MTNGNGFIVINEKGWERMTTAEKEWATFNTLKSIDTRLKKLERRPIIDKCFAFIGGVIGGFAAALGLKWGG